MLPPRDGELAVCASCSVTEESRKFAARFGTWSGAVYGGAARGTWQTADQRPERVVVEVPAAHVAAYRDDIYAELHARFREERRVATRR